MTYPYFINDSQKLSTLLMEVLTIFNHYFFTYQDYIVTIHLEL